MIEKSPKDISFDSHITSLSDTNDLISEKSNSENNQLLNIFSDLNLLETWKELFENTYQRYLRHPNTIKVKFIYFQNLLYIFRSIKTIIIIIIIILILLSSSQILLILKSHQTTKTFIIILLFNSSYLILIMTIHLNQGFCF